MKKSLGALVLVLASGCYTTRVASAGASFDHLPEAEVHSDRQWFAFDGLAALTNPAGGECRHGLSTATSRYTFLDFLISTGVAAVGGVATMGACSNQSRDTQAACFIAGANLATFLLGSRTVHYTCQDDVVPPAPTDPVLPPSSNLLPTQN